MTAAPRLLLAAALCFAVPLAARADPLRVGLLVPAPASPAVAFLRAELLAAGFSVEELPARARRDDLFALVAPDPRGARASAEVSFERSNEPPTTIDVGAIEGGPEGSRLLATLAVRVSERLRARAQELATRPPPPPPVVAAAPAPRPPALASLRLELVVSGALAFAELGVAAGPGLALSWRHRGGALVRLGVEGLFSGSRLAAPGGDATVTQTLALVEGGWEANAGRWAPAFTAGLGAEHVLARGRAQPGFLADTESALALALSLGASLGLRLGGRLSAVLGARALHLVAAPDILVAGQRVGHVPPLAGTAWAGLRLVL